MASSFIAEGRFKTLSKCSAHLPRIFSLSVMRVEPSALSSGEVPDEVGP